MEDLKKKYTKTPLKGDIYNPFQLKIILDDLLKEYITKVKKSKQSMLLTDVRIMVGLMSTVIAGVIAYLSMKTEFVDHKWILIVLIAIYLVANAILDLYSRYFGTSIVYDNMTVSTTFSPPDPTYVVIVYSKDKLIPDKYIKSIFDLFDSNGKLFHEEFLNDLNKLFKKNN